MPLRKKPGRATPATGRNFELVLIKEAERALSQQKLDGQIAHIKSRALSGGRSGKVWKCRVGLKRQDLWAHLWPAAPMVHPDRLGLWRLV
jgi:hypothetical protein